MARSAALGIKRLENIDFYVNDMARSHAFYTECVDFRWVAESTQESMEALGQVTRVYEAEAVRMTVSAPDKSHPAGDGPVRRYLKRHPDGIARLTFEVEDVAKTFAVLDERGATIVADIEWMTNATGGRYGHFEITTAFGEATFRFVQRDDFADPRPDLTRFPEPRGGDNTFGFVGYDHVTSNFLSLGPMVLWCKEVLGLEEYWGINFHTDDVAPDNDHGSGLKSVVLWDPYSGVKFANNEPLRPYFTSSQIYIFVMENHGEGIQHAALTTGDILSTVKGLNSRGVRFMPTPGTYYDALPERLKTSGIIEIEEDIDELRELGVLIDGDAHQSYLLQIFLKEAAGLYEDERAGPFFFEVIQRKGDNGFGGGNFRALFESIEREQKALAEAS